jgi:hypothetical protein
VLRSSDDWYNIGLWVVNLTLIDSDLNCVLDHPIITVSPEQGRMMRILVLIVKFRFSLIMIFNTKFANVGGFFDIACGNIQMNAKRQDLRNFIGLCILECPNDANIIINRFFETFLDFSEEILRSLS